MSSRSVLLFGIGLVGMGLVQLGCSTLEAREDAVAPSAFTARIDAEGTLSFGPRSIPFPATASREARAVYIRMMREAIARAAPGAPSPLDDLNAAIAAGQERVRVRNALALSRYGASAEERIVGGVKTIWITPAKLDEKNRDRVLLNLHGGAFMFYSGTVNEAVPVASLGHVRVVAVDYRMPPAHPFPAGLDDVVAVYRTLLADHRPEDIGIYGTSAGANLSAATVLRLKQLGLPQPGAIAVVSYGWGDSAIVNDGLDPYLSSFGAGSPDFVAAYAAGHDVADPLITPIHGDFHDTAPALLVSGTRDLFLSGTALLQRRMQSHGVDARLVVFEAMWHGFNADINIDEEIPEAVEASRVIADHFARALGRPLNP